MREGWKKIRLEEVADDVSMGPFGSNIKVDNFISEGVPVIRGGNLNEFGFENSDFVFISEEKANSLKRSLAYPDDLVFTHRGTIGQVGIIPHGKYPKYLVSQSQMKLTVSKKHLDPRFLYYFFKSTKGQYELLKNASQVGVPAIASPTRAIKDVEIDIPPLETQRRIATILSGLDEKIELNRQTNQTLEGIAQALFKEWFVEFNFPGATGEVQESELGPIPTGWSVAKLEDIVSIKHGFAFKGEFFSEEETNDILITPGNFRIGGGFNYSKFKYYDGEYPLEYLLNRGDLVITMTDLSKEGDTLGYPALVPHISGKKLLHNQRIGKVELKKNNSFKTYLYFTMRQNNYRNYVLSGATGTTVKHTSPGRICDYMLVIPAAEVLQKFEKITQSLIDNIEFVFLQNQELAQTRDILLPKLMNGEIEV